MKSFNDKVVVITGAGSGMGREMALIAARQGALLAVSDWNEQGLAETVDLLKAAGARRRARPARIRRQWCRAAGPSSTSAPRCPGSASR